MLERLAAIAGILGLLIAILALLRDTYDFTVPLKTSSESSESSSDSQLRIQVDSEPTVTPLPSVKEEDFSEDVDLPEQARSKSLDKSGSTYDDISQATPEVRTQETLSSDYELLEKFLLEGEWQYADAETQKIIIESTKYAIQNMDIDDFIATSNFGWLDRGIIQNSALNKLDTNYLWPAEIKLTPCEVLHDIELLWSNYSEERFGLSTQKRIYLETTDGETDGKVNLNGFGNPWFDFAGNVGWANKKYPSEYEFSMDAPYGHLPSMALIFNQLGQGFYYMMFRIDQCGL